MLVLKPNMANALVPILLRNLFYSAVVALIILGTLFGVNYTGIFAFSISSIFYWIIYLLLAVSLVHLGVKLIILYNTKYYFYRTHVLSEFELVKISKYSLPYHQITNISTHISLWDRMCGAGDIILYTPEDVGPNLVLEYVKEPHKLESGIYKMVHAAKKT